MQAFFIKKKALFCRAFRGFSYYFILKIHGANFERRVAKKLTQKGAAKVETREHGLYKKPRKRSGVSAKYENCFRATMPALSGPASRLTKALRSLAVPEAI